MNYLKKGLSTSQRDKVEEIGRPLTPPSERRYPGRIAPVGMPDLGCPGSKCLRRVGHAGDHWPK